MHKTNELKYIHQIGLQNLKKVPSGYMCSCPICKEGSSPWKTRFYILTEKKDYITVYCQKCSYCTNFKTFLREYSPYIFAEYQLEDRQELLSDLKNGTLVKKQNYKSDWNKEVELKYKFKLNEKYFQPAINYKAAYEFCKRRNIVEYIHDLYYNVHPDSMLSGMIVFPFIMGDRETLYGFQGRHTEKKLFHTYSKNESMKVYNLYNVDVTKTVYAFESIIDSLMMDNTIAMLGTTLSENVFKKLKDIVYVCDNDGTGLKRTLQYLNEGKKCFIFPDSFKFKDFNEAVMGGINKSTLPSLVEENTFQGLSGITKINFNLMKRKR
jgi:hypothetical protein